MVVNASGWRKTSNTRLEALIAFSVCSFQILFFYSWREGSQNELLEWMKAVGRRGKIVPFSYYVVIIILKQKKTIRGVTFFIPKFNCIVRITRANKFIYGNCILLVMCRLDIFWFGAREEDGIWSDDDDEFSRKRKDGNVFFFLLTVRLLVRCAEVGKKWAETTNFYELNIYRYMMSLIRVTTAKFNFCFRNVLQLWKGKKNRNVIE